MREQIETDMALAIKKPAPLDIPIPDKASPCAAFVSGRHHGQWNTTQRAAVATQQIPAKRVVGAHINQLAFVARENLAASRQDLLHGSTRKAQKEDLLTGL